MISATIIAACGNNPSGSPAAKDSTAVGITAAGKEIPAETTAGQQDLSAYGIPILINLPPDARIFKTALTGQKGKGTAIGIAAGQHFKLEIIPQASSAEAAIAAKKAFYFDPAKDHALSAEEETPQYLQLKTPKEGTVYFFRAIPADKENKSSFLIQKGGDAITTAFPDQSFTFAAEDVKKMIDAAKSAKLK
ncbi:hypothetical protein CK934_13145 [Chitinophaga sp. MD30]|nr:hypothetical protein CK934_13145 [Chitinophaga sp. MD30]